MEGKASRLNIRLTAGEREAIRLRASQAGLSVSEYIRASALRDDSRPVIRTDAAALKKIYADLRRAGSNLNQCARELNTHHRPANVERELELAFCAIAKASEDVSAFIAETRKSI